MDSGVSMNGVQPEAANFGGASWLLLKQETTLGDLSARKVVRSPIHVTQFTTIIQPTIMNASKWLVVDMIVEKWLVIDVINHS